jgi:hypothetical protein
MDSRLPTPTEAAAVGTARPPKLRKRCAPSANRWLPENPWTSTIGRAHAATGLKTSMSTNWMCSNATTGFAGFATNRSTEKRRGRHRHRRASTTSCRSLLAVRTSTRTCSAHISDATCSKMTDGNCVAPVAPQPWPPAESATDPRSRCTNPNNADRPRGIKPGEAIPSVDRTNWRRSRMLPHV